MLDYLTPPWLRTALLLYAATETLFYAVFHFILVPKANHFNEPINYRDYGADRHLLLKRILKRVSRESARDGIPTKEAIVSFLAEWFHIQGDVVPAADDLSTDDDSGSSDDEAETSAIAEKSKVDEAHDIPKESMDPFFSWAFFGKPHENLEAWEAKELDKIYKILEDDHGVEFTPERTKMKASRQYVPRRMSLEPVKAMHRPLLVYIAVFFLRHLARMILFMKGFRRHTSSSGLVAWHKPGQYNGNGGDASPFVPMLFFHGIAPGGLFFYLPMVLGGLATEPERPVLLFENKAISCVMDFSPLNEAQNVDGVVEILDKLNYSQSDLHLVGHSFGSCPITWLVASKRLPNIRQISLIDPVTILLSNPDVLVNFLYSEQMSKIRMVASSELFTEYFIRRHFAGYNSEFWLEDVHTPKDSSDSDGNNSRCHLLVCLAEKDEIANAVKVKAEVDHFKCDSTDVIFWKGAGHADCVTSPEKWSEIKQAMLKQELSILAT